MPPKKKLIPFLEDDHSIVWFYGEGFLGKIQAWIIRNRIRMTLNLLKETLLKSYNRVLDIGCGPMFINYALVVGIKCEYVGVDIMPIHNLKKYRDAMRNVSAGNVEAVRASGEALPFRNMTFDIVLSLEILEHLKKPRDAILQISQVVNDNGIVAISLPLENFVSWLSRIGLVLMKIRGNHVLNRLDIPVTRKPDYHYVGDVDSYDAMIEVFRDFFYLTHSRYTPLGLHRSINVHAIHMAQKRL